MGFIDWQGNKGDRFHDAIGQAEENKKAEETKREAERIRRADLRLFDVPELESLQTDEILKLLLREKTALDTLHSNLIRTVNMDDEIESQFYKDFWLYWVGLFLSQGNLEEEKRNKTASVILNQVFRINNRTDIEVHYKKLAKNEAYQEYIRNSFELVSGGRTVFWQWIGYLEHCSYETGQGKEFADLFSKFLMHFGFYLNQLVPGQKIGKKQAERKSINEMVIRLSMAEYQIEDYMAMMYNPLYNPLEEEKAKKYRELINKFRKLFKYARTIISNFTLLEDGDGDMIAAGRLYTNIKENVIPNEKILKIFPEQAADILSRGNLPKVDAVKARFIMRDNEILHYYENAISYRQDLYDEEHFRTARGTFFITNQRVQFQTGNKRYDYLLEDIGKIVLYDALPNIMALTLKDSVLFIQTADTNETYQFLKMIISGIEEPEKEPLNMEELSADTFKEADIPAYVFGLKALIDFDMPDQLQNEILEMANALEKLDEALKKYPSHKEVAHRFFTYYIPETMRLIFTYNEYENAELSERRMNPVYNKVMMSIRKVSVAANQRVEEIYQLATMDTVAKADALQRIMGKDGYIMGDGILRKD